MPSIKEQFEFKIIRSYYEKDTHSEVVNSDIEFLRILSGESADDDILVVQYKESPNLSFFDSNGKLLDVDHYLPDNYTENDNINVEAVISNLKENDMLILKSKMQLDALIKETYNAGNQDFIIGLSEKFGLQTNKSVIQNLFPTLNLESVEETINFIQNSYYSFYNLLNDIIINQQKSGSGYIHITPSDNIVITPLNKRSGLSVIIETQNVDNNLLPPHKWNILRTLSTSKLEQTLVFRTDDVKDYFTDSAYTTTFETERYKLFYNNDELSIDSYLDNTDNLLKVNIINGCYKIMSSDQNIIVALTKDKEITIINTHKSVVPSKWPKKIQLPESTLWMRIDENISIVFCQNEKGMISCYDITQNFAEKISDLGIYAERFELDQKGHIICRDLESNELIKLKTNIQEIQPTDNQLNFNTIIKNLSPLFKGEGLFVKTKFAKPIPKTKVKPENKLPTLIEKARYDFETNVESMLISSNNSYEDLMQIKNKIAIARQNITEELMVQADKENIFLVGQRLKSTINNIMLPTEIRIKNLVEGLRAKTIITSSRSLHAKTQSINDAYNFREILNTLRIFEEELSSMLPYNSIEVLGEFKEIQDAVNVIFSEEILKEDNTLQKFIKGEIEEIEEAIKNTHFIKTLENLLGTHPAAMELMTLIKQPFVLQSIAKEKKLSPAAIQNRLFKAVQNRKLAIIGEKERKLAQKNEAKHQLSNMIKDSIDFFVINHSSGFADIELSVNPTYQSIQNDISKLEKNYSDIRLAIDLRRLLNRRILERTRINLEKRISFEGKYAFIKNDPHLFVDLESVSQKFPKWHLELSEKKGSLDQYLVSFIKESDKEVYRPSTTDNLRSGKAFEISGLDYSEFFEKLDLYIKEDYSLDLLEALWNILEGNATEINYPQYANSTIDVLLPKTEIERKALRCALEKKKRDDLEKIRKRNVPEISPEFIDNTPFFKHKLHEFIIKAKLQLASGSGILLLTGPPSTGKSAFLKYAASIMNREYFEHASDKWQTKNSLITAIRFGEFGPYSVPAGFTKAITTPNTLINIEEIKEWPEALRKSLNPFFAGSKVFLSPDGTSYNIADNILLCAATNLGAIYRQDDEPFTADFWSRIEVVEYDYAPLHVSREYYNNIFHPKPDKLLTVQDLARKHFMYDLAPSQPENKAAYFSQQFIEFILLPKADEQVKRTNLANYINDYFAKDESIQDKSVSPEEAIKVCMNRIKDFQGYSPSEFYDLFDHFVNNQKLRSSRLSIMKINDNNQYEHLKVLVLCIGHIEACLRSLRDIFYTSAGQTEIEGTNREYIKCIYLLGLMGRL